MKVYWAAGDDGIALITLDNPPVNALDTPVFNGLYKSFKEIQSLEGIRAIVIRGADGKFSAGADIRSDQKRQCGEAKEEELIVPKVAIIDNIIEGCEKPVVAVIEGFALGGGLELAMACHARIASKGARLGLPQLQLGIIPGLGGTQRLPRLVGVEKALDMLLNSKAIDAAEAKELGLVDDVAEPSSLLSVAKMIALELLDRERDEYITINRMNKVGNTCETQSILNKARNLVRKKFRNVRYPSLCLQIIEEGLRKGGAMVTKLENEISTSLTNSPEAKALMHMFFVERSAYKIPGLTDAGMTARLITKVGIVGCGFMGAGIATSLIVHNISVILKDQTSVLLEASMKQIKGHLQSLVRKGKINKVQALKSLDFLMLTEDYTALRDADLILESVPETLSLKRKIFHDLESVCSEDCLLVSNTSSLDINAIGAGLSHPERIAGAHFFSPAHVMPLLEIVKTEKTSPQTLIDLLGLAKALEKIPLVVKSYPGFAVNRLFVPYLMTATLLVDLGLDLYRVDAVIKEFGMPMGPFRVADFTGIKTFQMVSQKFHEHFPGRFHNSPIVKFMVNDNRLGDTTRRGFYDYKESGEQINSVQVKEYIEKSRQLAQLNGSSNIIDTSDTEIVEMIFYPLVNEACRIVEDNIVTGPAALDIASVFGMGFPAYRGGIIFWADSIGLSHIFNRLNQLCNLYGHCFAPSFLLEKLAAAKTPLGQFSTRGSNL